MEVFLNTYHRRSFSINDEGKSYREKTVLKSLQLEFSSFVCFLALRPKSTAMVIWWDDQFI